MKYVMKLINKDGVLFTQYRFIKKQYEKIRKTNFSKPTKENSRYVYFEVEGDLLNRPKRRIK